MTLLYSFSTNNDSLYGFWGGILDFFLIFWECIPAADPGRDRADISYMVLKAALP